MQSVVQTGNALHLLRRCLLQIQVGAALDGKTQGVLHMRGAEAFETEYGRVVHFFLFEQMKRMNGIQDGQNPFQSDRHRVAVPWVRRR